MVINNFLKNFGNDSQLLSQATFLDLQLNGSDTGNLYPFLHGVIINQRHALNEKKCNNRHGTIKFSKWPLTLAYRWHQASAIKYLFPPTKLNSYYQIFEFTSSTLHISSSIDTVDIIYGSSLITFPVDCNHNYNIQQRPIIYSNALESGPYTYATRSVNFGGNIVAYLPPVGGYSLLMAIIHLYPV